MTTRDKPDPPEDLISSAELMRLLADEADQLHEDDGDEDDQDGWNSDGFDTSREATLAREIMGQRGDDIGGYRDEGLYGDDSDGGFPG